MQNLIEKEDRLRADACALVECGMRPKVVRLIIGSAISINDCAYLFRLLTPLALTERHGRVKFNVMGVSSDRKQPSGYRSLTADGIAFCIKVLDLVTQAISLGASRADALASAWRIEAGSRNIPLHLPISGITAEDFAFIWLNYKAEEIAILKCDKCEAPFLDRTHALHRCPRCQVGRRALTRNVA